MNNKNKHTGLLFILVLIHLMMFSFAVSAERVSPGPITKIDLGVTELNLSVGESYTFAVSYEPEDTVLTTLDWQVTDENVIRIDPMTDTVTALAEGEARIFAESFDGFSYAVCTVTVGDAQAKDASVMKSGDAYFGLSPEDMKKISAETLNRYLDFIADSSLDEAAYQNVSERYFDLLGAVKPGTEQAQSQRAMECGMAESVPLSELNAITLTGSLSAILKYAQNNPDLVEIFELGPFYLEEPEVLEGDSDIASKAASTVTLEGETQAITNIDHAHELGLTGKGRWIAVIDTGVYTDNAQFEGDRKIIEECFSYTGDVGNYQYRSVCKTNAEEKGAAAPANAWKKADFDHGTHVAGIAVGKGGIAPQANLVAIQAFSERVWTCKDAQEGRYYSCGADHPNMCCKSSLRNAQIGQAYEYLLEIAKTKKIQIDAVNMSYGGGSEYANACDSDNGYEKRYFDKMIAAGMVPVVASGNNGYNNGVNDAACLSNAYSVGNLLNQANPIVYRDTSNVGPTLSIAAPGSEIYSAGYTEPMMYMSGTSMAAPMVSGAVALVRQIYPGMTVKDVEFYLKSISQKRVFQRADGHQFSYQKPVLTFGNILKLIVPYYDWISGGDHSIIFKVDRMSRQVKFSAKVTDLNNNSVSGIKVEWKSDGNYTYVKVFGNALQNDTVYKVNLTRTVKIGEQTYSSSTLEFGRSMRKAEKPTAVGGNGFVSLTGQAGTVRYNFYDAATGKFVDFVNRPDGSQTDKITGFVNGKLYTVGMVPYLNDSVNGQNQKISFYGVESARVSFMPMSEPFNAKVTYPTKDKSSKATVSCTADTAANGIIAEYRKADTNDEWTQGCKTTGNKFTCTIQNVGQGYEFRIRKYAAVKNKTYAGPAVIIKGSK